MPDRPGPVGPVSRPRPAVVLAGAGGLAGALAAAFLLAPPMGTDLSAQVARAAFFGRHGGAVLDLGWYAGISPYGYSLLTPPLMSAAGDGTTGPRVVGAVALVASALALALLLLRTAARRPLLAGLVGAVCVAGNLVSGRVTYAVGVLFGLLALLALTVPRSPPAPAIGTGPTPGGPAGGLIDLSAAPPARVTRPRLWPGRLAAVLAALLASAASPVAGLFTGLAGVALLAGATGRRRRVDGVLLAVASAVPLAVTGLLFGAGGWMNISLLDAVRAVAASLVVALAVPVRPVRVGALLSAVGVAVAYLAHTPVGLNATRLAVMFALPVLAGYAVPPAWIPARLTRPAGRWASPVALAATLALLAWIQPPVSLPDLRAAGDRTSSRAYFAPLLAELARRGPGRVEVVPTANYWEAAYVPAAAPLAKGWLRQVDQARNRLFLDGSVDPGSYHDWLRDNAVALVAVADGEPSWVGRREAALVRGGLPYLTEVWRGGAWTLYAVTDPTSLVDGARLVAADDTQLTVDVSAAGPTTVRLRWSRWLRVEGPLGPVGPVGVAGSRSVVRPGCLAPGGEWTTLRVAQPGRYRISGSLTDAGPRC